MNELKWIQAKVKPSTERKVLLWVDKQGPRIGYWSESYSKFYSERAITDSEQKRITHWADVPEPQ